MSDDPANPVENPPGAGGPVGRDGRATGGHDAVSGSAYDCPRCGTTVASDFYGPCGNCRNELRATIAGEAIDIDVGDYAPKMNVTPNAVALKE